MAVLQNIRNKAGLLIGIIAFALLAFLLGDMLNNGSFGRPDRTIAVINGEKVPVDEYQSLLNEITEVYKMNSGQASLDNEMTERIQDEAWNSLVRTHVLANEYENTGIAVHADELFELVQGNNIHPMIRQIFANPQTGQVDKAQILAFLKSFDQDGGADREAYWMFIEKELLKSRLNEKYNTLITKGLYVNTEEAKYAIEGAKTYKDIDYFTVPYSSISDSSIEVSPTDISTYYTKNKDSYKQTEARDIEFVNFNIVASLDDDAAVSKWSQERAKELKEQNDIKELVRYIKFNSDEAWNEVFYSKDEVNENLKDFAFNSEVGAVYGPYKEASTYKVVKLASREMRSDSVKASHILVQESSLDRTKEVADSLYEVIKNNKSKMASLAESFSKDQASASEGGDLGWFNDGEAPKAINDAAFNAKKGEVVKVKTQYGTHIIYVTQKSKAVEKVQLAGVIRKVEASNTTHRNTYTQASKFRAESMNAESFNEKAKELGLRARAGRNITRDSKNVMGLQDSKELVKWAYNAEVGEVSDVVELNGQFVVATLTNVTEKGYRPVGDVESIIKTEVIKEKKAAQIIADINSKKGDSQTITSLASKMNAAISTAPTINFPAYSLQGAGVEPKVIGAVSSSEKDVISEAIAGNRGVYVFKVTSTMTDENNLSIENQKMAAKAQKAYTSSFQAYNTLQEKANIEDKRLILF